MRPGEPAEQTEAHRDDRRTRLVVHNYRDEGAYLGVPTESFVR